VYEASGLHGFSNWWFLRCGSVPDLARRLRGLVADPRMYQNSTLPAQSLVLMLQIVSCAMLPEAGCPAR
jgi:hypothetical protein